MPHTRKKERRVICKEFGMKLIAITFLTVTAAFAQTAEPRLAITDAEKIADALRAGPVFITKGATLLDWPPASGGEYRVLRKARTNGPVSRLFPGIRMMNQGASTRYSCTGFRTAWPAGPRALIASASRTCIVAPG